MKTTSKSELRTPINDFLNLNAGGHRPSSELTATPAVNAVEPIKPEIEPEAGRQFTTACVSLQGSKWQVLEWQDGEGEWCETRQEFTSAWVQIGPYYDSEAEADAAIVQLGGGK